MSTVSHELHVQGEAAKVLLANIRDVIGDDEEMIAVAVEGETDLVEAISGAVDRIAELETFEEALKLQIKSLSERKARFEGQRQRLRAAIMVAMGQAEMRKLELPQATISIKATPVTAEITDEAAIPSKFWVAQDPTLDKKAVLAALKAKEAVPGAALSNGGETISIR